MRGRGVRVKSRGSACGTRVEGIRIWVEGLGCQGSCFRV